MQRSLIDQNKRKQVSSITIKNNLLSDHDFLTILTTITLGVNEKLKIVISDNDGIELPPERLEKIFSIMNSITEIRFSFVENLETLRDLIWETLDDQDINNLTLKKESLRKELELDPENKKNKVGKVIEDLEGENLAYLTYEQICNALKTNFNLEVNKSSKELSCFLKDLGYINKRKSIEGKQVRVWIKVN